MKKENINDFRSEIFKLCNEIKKNDSLHIIQETLEKLFMCENIEEKIPSNIFFHQIAKHGNNQFMVIFLQMKILICIKIYFQWQNLQ